MNTLLNYPGAKWGMAAHNIFGKSYAYREKYNAYKKQRMEEERKKAALPQLDGQMMMEFV